MRWTTANAQYGYSGTWGAPTTGPTPEQVFGVFQNAYTKTATITLASFARGCPAILTAASASNNGYAIVNADTAGQVTNELFVGVVFDYPDTTVGSTGVWQPEDFGIVQCYGVATYAIIANATVTQASGLILTPNTGSALATLAQLVAPSGTGSSATGALVSGVAGLAVLYATVASSSAAGTVAGTVWLRCM